MIAVGLSDPGSGKGAVQVLREPLWETKQALVPADARLHGREELALQTLSIRHRMELIYFALFLCTAFVLLCVFCVHNHACVCVCVWKIKRRLCACVRIHMWVFVHDWTYLCVHVCETPFFI